MVSHGAVQCCLMLGAVLSFSLMETDDLHPPLDTELVIGREMRRIRERLGITQQELAERMIKNGFRFHQTQVAKMERGERPIRVNEWIAIATALGMAPLDMLSAAISANVSKSKGSSQTIAELEREKVAIERRIDVSGQVMDAAAHEAAAARRAKEAAESTLREVEERWASAQALHHQLLAARGHLDRRIFDMRALEVDALLDGIEMSSEARDTDSIGERLAAARKQAGMSPEHMAIEASLTPEVVRILEEPNYLAKISSGLNKGSVDFRENLDHRHNGMKSAITRYAKVLNLDADQLIRQYENEVMKQGE